jgi:hypothetical protein
MTCEETKGLFAEALYGELPDARMAAFNAHLAACSACAREFEGLRRTIDLANRRARVEPTPAEWEAFTAKLDARLTAEGARREADGVMDENFAPPARGRSARVIPWLPAIRPAYGYGIAAVLLVAFGIYMGRTFFNGATPGPAAPGDSAVTADAGPGPVTAKTEEASAVNRDALAYLERSRNLLIGLTNMSESQMGAVDFSRSRKVSRELYDRGNTLAVALNRPSQQQLRQLVQGLQMILLQLSNMEVAHGTPVVEMIRKGVDSRSILLKINLEAIRAALNEESLPPADAGDKNSL